MATVRRLDQGNFPKDAAAIIVTTSGNPDPGTKTFMFTAVTQLGSIPWSSKGAPQPKPSGLLHALSRLLHPHREPHQTLMRSAFNSFA